MANYNLTRYVENLLKNTESLSPSFTVHLKSAHWCLNNFNAGAKFAYNHQVASLLDDIRAQRIPVDLLELFDSEKVPFYEGCLVVELRDYRPRDNIDDFISSRVVLQPNSETLWADTCQLNQRMGYKWSDQEALDVEARVLLATAPPLCLDPDPHLVRAANSTLRVSVPTAPASLKRKAPAMDPEETAFEKVRRAKILHFMRPSANKPKNWKVLEAIQRKKLGIPATAPPVPLSQPTPAPQPPLPQPTPGSSTPAPQSTSPVYEDQRGPRNGVSSASPVTGGAPTPVPQARVAAPSYQQDSPPLPSQSPSKVVPTPRQPSADPHKQVPSPQSQPQATTPSVQQPQQSQTPVQPTQPHAPYNIPNFQPTIPPANFLGQAPFAAKKKGGPQTQQHPPVSQAQMQLYAFQQQQFQHAAVASQRFNQGAQQPQPTAPTTSSPVAATRSPMTQNAQAAPNPSRPSPLAANQPQTSRSPMPQTAQQSTPQPQHAQQPTPQQQQQHAYNLAYYNAARMQAQAIAAGLPPPPQLAAHMTAQANSSQAQQSGQASTTSAQAGQDQNQAHPLQIVPGYTPMFNMNYAQTGLQMQPGRMPQSYPWTMGYRRGVPANGQPQAPTAAANANGHPQQMTVGRTMPGSVQGR